MEVATEELIRRFYRAFSTYDTEMMVSCYHPNAVFHDPVFCELNAREVRAMWSMLIERGRPDLVVILTDVNRKESIVEARWEAKYMFSKTGRKIHNYIQAGFEFEDGLIIRHTDTFNLYSWTKMAFGWKGILFGWTPWFKKKLRSAARHGLNKWMAKADAGRDYFISD